MKNKFIIGSLLALSLGLSSCLEEEDKSYDGPLEVQFDSSPATAITRTITAPASGSRIDSFQVQLIGPHQGEAIVGTYVVDPTSTAQQGTHYTLLNTPNQYTIPAGSSFGYVKYSVTKPVAPVTLKFSLESTDKVRASENYKTATTTIR